MPDAMERHRLRREIVATQLANAIINRGGSTVVVRLADQTGADAPTIASAYAAVRDSYDLISLNGAIDKLDGVVPGAVQLRLYRSRAGPDAVAHGLVHQAYRLEPRDAGAVVTRYRTGIQEVSASISTTLEPVSVEASGRRAASLMGEGVPEALAVRIATLPAISTAPDIAMVAAETGRPVPEIAATHFAVASRFKLAEIVAASRDVPVADYYDRLALDRALATIEAAHRALTVEVAARGEGSGTAAVAGWAREPRPRDGAHRCQRRGHRRHRGCRCPS